MRFSLRSLLVPPQAPGAGRGPTPGTGCGWQVSSPKKSTGHGVAGDVGTLHAKNLFPPPDAMTGCELDRVPLTLTPPPLPPLFFSSPDTAPRDFLTGTPNTTQLAANTYRNSQLLLFFRSRISNTTQLTANFHQRRAPPCWAGQQQQRPPREWTHPQIRCDRSDAGTDAVSARERCMPWLGRSCTAIDSGERCMPWLGHCCTAVDHPHSCKLWPVSCRSIAAIESIPLREPAQL